MDLASGSKVREGVTIPSAMLSAVHSSELVVWVCFGGFIVSSLDERFGVRANEGWYGGLK